MDLTTEFLIVGSGPSAAMAALTLANAGKKAMVADPGNKDEIYADKIPKSDFISIREKEQNQHEYFLGKNFEGIPWGKIQAGSQLTPPRKFIVRDVESWLPVISETFRPMESMAQGGLASGWGTGCHVFSTNEMEEAGMDATAMQGAYDWVAEQIGISGEKDDANPYCLGHIQHFQPAPNLDENAEALLKKYRSGRKALNQMGFYAGKLALAVLSKPKDGRDALAYDDLNFWSDHGGSAWRPWVTMKDLEKKNMLDYRGGIFVTKMVESDQGIKVRALNTKTFEKISITARKVILCAGALGSARIVMRSFPQENLELPLLSNPYCYMPCIQWARLGKPDMGRKAGFGQTGIFYDPQGDPLNGGMGAMFSYRGLLLFKLLKEAPIPFKEARIIFQYLQSSFMIAGIHHPVFQSKTRNISLVPHAQSPTGDALKANFTLSESEQDKNLKREKLYKKALGMLGCFPLKTISPGHGASIHYAGTLPFGSGQPYSLYSNGLLAGTKNIFVGDGSGFRYLPSKGLTLSLMANAHLVAKESLKNYHG